MFLISLIISFQFIFEFNWSYFYSLDYTCVLTVFLADCFTLRSLQLTKYCHSRNFSTLILLTNYKPVSNCTIIITVPTVFLLWYGMLPSISLSFFDGKAVQNFPFPFLRREMYIPPKESYTRDKKFIVPIFNFKSLTKFWRLQDKCFSADIFICRMSETNRIQRLQVMG